MKSILELISMIGADGTSAITDVKIRINQLMELTEGGFNVGESGSRDVEDGTLTDLRTSLPLETQDFRTTEIRRRLTLLQNEYNLIKFEEKINDETHQLTFIIIEVDYLKFLNKTTDDFKLPAHDMHSPEVNSVVIRNGLHGIHCKYIKIKVGNEIAYPIQDLQILEGLSLEERPIDVINYRKSNQDEPFSIMDYLASPDPKAFHEIKSKLNQFCDLSLNNGFDLYFQSSNPDFPIDLRVFFDKEDEKGANAQLKLSGLVQFSNALIYEVKAIDDSNKIAVIIKAINKAQLEDYFTHKQQEHLEEDPLQKALALIKRYFPNDKHIQNLAIVSGEGSYTRPFPHIRTQKFWSISQVDQSTIAALTLLDKVGCIDFDQRPENKYTVEKRNNAKYIRVGARPVNFENDNFQLIIVPKNLKLLEEKLDSLMSFSYRTRESFNI